MMFPINNPLREILLTLEWIIVFIFLELAIIFWIRVKRHKAELKSFQEPAFLWLFLGYSLRWLFIIIADYHVETAYIRAVLVNIGYIALIISALFFINIMEKRKIFLKKYLFTKIFVAMIIIYVIILLIDINLGRLFSHMFWPVFTVFFIIYLKKLALDFYIKRSLGSFKLDFLKFCIGSFLVFVGYQLTLDSAIRTFGFQIRLLGDIFQLIGLIFIILFIMSIPSFSEYDYQEKIESIYIMHMSGLFLYKKTFREKTDDFDETVVSGTIASIKMMLESVSDKKGGILTIEKRGKIIVIQPGKYVIGVLICDEKLNSLQMLLNKFIEKIETIFSHFLMDWKGELNVFKPIDDIVKEIFW